MMWHDNEAVGGIFSSFAWTLLMLPCALIGLGLGNILMGILIGFLIPVAIIFISAIISATMDAINCLRFNRLLRGIDRKLEEKRRQCILNNKISPPTRSWYTKSALWGNNQ